MIALPSIRRGARLLLATAIACTLALGATASAWADTKIGVVDLQKVLRTTKRGKDAQKKFDSVRDAKKKGLEKTDKDLQKRQKELMSGRMEIEKAVAELQGKAPGDELKARAAAFQEQAKKFEQDLMDFEKAQRSTVEDLARKEADLLKPIEDIIRKQVETVAKERQLTVVLSKQLAVYSADGLDITDEVIKRCDALP